MFYTVALLSAPYTTLTYAANKDFSTDVWQVGLRVSIPLGRGALRVGIILASSEHANVPDTVTIKELGWPLERQPLLDVQAVQLVQELAIRQGCTPGAFWGHLLPRGLRSSQVSIRLVHTGMPQILRLSAVVALPDVERQKIAHALWAGEATFVASHGDGAGEELCILQIDPPWPVRPAAVRQIAVLDFLLDHGKASRRDVMRHIPGAGSVLSALVKAGYVRIENAQTEACEAEEALLPPPMQPFVLSLAQVQAVDACSQLLQQGRAATRLLFGVTGSGKTAVYLELARQCLALGKSVIILAPEVALALKLRRDVALALPHTPVFLYHGYQSPQQREKTFRTLAGRVTPCVLVGTRSALFLPVSSLGLIVLDEEHDASFKQDEGVPYQAKEVAWFRARQSQALLLLGSATPDVKTFYAARQGSLPLLHLPDRVGGGQLPAVDLVDISNLAQDMLAPASRAALQEVVKRGEQAIVLLNRRGYAPQLYCLDCKRVARCPNCEISLTYHKSRERLICHYCGYSMPFPSPCPQCLGMHYRPIGEGTEKLAERLGQLLGGSDTVLRLDKDSTRRPGRMEEILEAFAQRKASVLVGTQMLSKGHHFPGVTLALIADGDVGLNLPDYRAAERTFQLLVQSSGRAGRTGKGGRVLIQTRDTQHYCWTHVRTGDFEGFYEEEIGKRKARLYPPFVRLARLRISFPLTVQGYDDILRQLAEYLRGQAQIYGVRVLGPVAAPLAILRAQRRFHCLIKAQDWQSVRAIYLALRAENFCKDMQLYLDIDPVNML